MFFRRFHNAEIGKANALRGVRLLVELSGSPGALRSVFVRAPWECKVLVPILLDLGSKSDCVSSTSRHIVVS